MKTFVTLALLLSFSNMALAVAVKGSCVGIVGKNKFVFTGSMKDALNVKSGSGKLYQNGRHIADFDGDEAKMSILRGTFRAENARGNILDVKLTNMAKKTGIAKRIYVREYGVDLYNVPVQCK